MTASSDCGSSTAGADSSYVVDVEAGTAQHVGRGMRTWLAACLVAQVLMRLAEVSMASLLCVYCWEYRQGLAVRLPSDSNILPLCNWHVLVTTLAAISIGEGSVAFRWSIFTARKWRKVQHALLQSVGTVLLLVGVTAAFLCYNHLDVSCSLKHMQTPHSWAGVTTAALMLVQLLLGLAAFVWPGFSSRRRAALLPLHRFLGHATYCLVVLCLVTGMQSQSRTYIAAPGSMASYDSKALLLNFGCASVLLWAGTVLFLQLAPSFWGVDVDDGSHTGRQLVMPSLPHAGVVCYGGGSAATATAAVKKDAVKKDGGMASAASASEMEIDAVQKDGGMASAAAPAAVKKVDRMASAASASEVEIDAVEKDGGMATAAASGMDGACVSQQSSAGKPNQYPKLCQ